MVMTTTIAPSSLELTQNAMAIKNHIIREMKDKLKLQNQTNLNIKITALWANIR
jgi:hypothetical protein